MLSFPPFRLDLAEGRLWKGDRELRLRRKPLAILCHLAARPQTLVTQDELLRDVWGGVVVSDSAMRSHLHELRQVLGAGVIETVIGRGYRFIAEIEAPTAPLPKPTDPVFVGREAELELLRATLARAREGRRQICFVTGEPGIGKSSLVRRFVGDLDPRAFARARGGNVEQHGTPEPYLSIIEALSGLARSQRAPEVHTTLARCAPTFVAQLPQLVHATELAEAHRRAVFGNEARQLRELCEAFEALAAREPLLLVLEDMQWSDVATIDLLSLLGQRPQAAKLLVIATARHADVQRPEHPLNPVMRSLVARSGAAQLRLSKMSAATVQGLIDARFGGHAFPQRLTAIVEEITGGTPLYVTSLLDELADRGMLEVREGAWTLAVSLEAVGAHRPTSVQQLIDLQLDRLTLAEQRALEAASVVGVEVAPQLLASALEVSAEQADEICDGLARRALFLRAERDGRYVFTHALVQEVCLDRSSALRRRLWHLRVADALSRDPRSAELSPLVARHFEAAGEPARALEPYLSAAKLAAGRHANADAVTLCGRALALVPLVPAGAARDLSELEILEAISRYVTSSSFGAVSAIREPRAIYDRAIELARAVCDEARLYRALTQRCNYDMIVARYDQTRATTTELELIEARSVIDPAALHAGIFARAYIAFFQGELSEAMRLFGRLLPPLDAPSPFHANAAGRALALAHIACARWVIGEPDRALEEADEAIGVAAESGVPVLVALGHVVRGRLRFLRRDVVPSLEEEALSAERAAWLDLGLLTEANALALWTSAQRGPLELSTIEPMLHSLRERLSAVSTCSTLVGLVLIEVLRVCGHAERAQALADEIITFARDRSEVVYLPELLRTRGEVRAALDRDGALRDHREAIERAIAMGARGFELRARAGLAALEQASRP